MKELLRIAWRNLWRNRRRTLLTAGGIGFAVALLAFAIAQQIGSYALMIDNATSLLTGHLQVRHGDYGDQPRIEHLVPHAAGLRARIEALPDVRAAAERVQAFALVAAGERSVAAQVLGVDVAREPALSALPGLVAAGRFLDVPHGEGTVEAFAGEALARNLGVAVGDELVILGTDAEGGVAALATRLVGTFASGQGELDRGLLFVPLEAAREAFALGDGAHAIVVRALDAARAAELAQAVAALDLPEQSTVAPWPALMPELQQSIELDQVSARIFYGLLALLVSFSVVNSFVMVVFERTREFGVLLAIGMRPWHIVGMLQVEALLLAALGALMGVAVAWPLVAWVAAVGMPLGEAAGEMLRRFHMPDRMYTALQPRAFLEPVLLMSAATAVAALLPALRVRRLLPVEALRAP